MQPICIERCIWNIKRDGWIQRVDVVREQPIHFGDISLIDGIRVDSLENIGSNKILTLFSRLEVKDYVDFYTIITKSKLSFDALFALAKQKILDLMNSILPRV